MKILAILVLTAAALSTAHPALAAPVPSDPVERCRGLLEIAGQAGGIAAPAAATVEPLGPDGCRFTGLRLDLGPGRSWTVGSLTAGGLDFARITQDRRLEAASLRAKDVRLKDSAVTAALGPDPVRFDAALDYRWDVATGTVEVAALSLSGAGLGEVAFSNRRGHVRADTFSFDLGPRVIILGLIAAGDLQALSFRFRDDGIVDRFITAGARGLADKDPGLSETERKLVLQQAIEHQVASMSAGGFPEPMVAPLVAFVRDFPSPRPITLTAAPIGTVPMPALLLGEDAGGATPAELFRRMNLTVAY
ncbi:hypothetical protein [Inquilinus limosus]|uniref:Uncharacterized protein n=1 Tax=Inquilinus limosus TaxID=171674 RepID=A0A211ZRI3_9PROT|nr:hypothetical protein [Inquilinus limosus]OWJ67860.1 hypothetical protein BWR60_07775 [Inquilinus limosus]